MLGSELLWGGDYFLIGRNGSVELSVLSGPDRTGLTLETFPVDSYPYKISRHEWIFYHNRGGIIETYSFDPRARRRFSFLGYNQNVSTSGKVAGTEYFINIPVFLPVVALGAAVGVILVFRRNKKLKHDRVGFPVE
jgi:hypothetical protein